MGRIGNSLSHLVLALSQSLHTTDKDAQAQGLSDASLKAIAFKTREFGRLMSTLTKARRQAWLAQSPLSEACRKTFRTLPVVPGQMLGPAAQQALEPSLQVNKVKQQFADFCQTPLPRPRHTRAPRPAANAQGDSRAGCLSFQQDHSNRAPQQPAFQTPKDRAPRYGPPADRHLKPPKGRGSRTRLPRPSRQSFLLTTSNPFLTLFKGYSIQFRRRPPKFNRVRITVVKDPPKVSALKWEISVLLEEGTIKCV